MAEQNFAVHETMEMHELITFKNVCMTKSQTMKILVSDERLKALMQKDVEQSTRAISELQSLLGSSRIQ